MSAEGNGNHWPPKWLIRSLFVAIPLVSAAQYPFMGSRIGETYPAIVMPLFAGSGGYSEGKVRVERLQIVFVTTGGDRLTFTPRELLSDFPDARHGAIEATAFTPNASRGAQPDRRPLTGFKSALVSTVYKVFRGLTIDQDVRQTARSLREWLRTRAESLAPGRAVQLVEFRWGVDTFSTVSGKTAADHDDAGVLVVSLEGT